jgi:hypothetical protein
MEANGSQTNQSKGEGTMLGDLIGEAISSIIGEAFIGWLFPNWHKRTPLPPEGEWNASLGSVAAFLGSLATMFVMTPIIVMIQGRSDEDVPLFFMLVFALVLCLVAGASARRAFRVTLRRRALALVGLWSSRVAFISGILATSVLLIRIMSVAR